jgi:PD-(D/E)XK endonuclease
VELLRNQINSKKQGDVGLGVAIGWFVRKGYHVSIPLTDSQDYDLVVEVDSHLCKVQVKTTYFQKYEDIYQVNLRVFGGNRSGTGKVKYFDPERVDYLFVLTEAGDMYFIPSHDIQSRSSMNLGEQYAPYLVE